MQKQRKFLTKQEENNICMNYEKNDYCEGCPLKFHLAEQYWLCYRDVLKLTNEIENFWNEKVDIIR